MSTTLTFVLSQKAKSSGGDKYVCESNSDFNIYFPQTISRKGLTQPLPKIVITIPLPIVEFDSIV